MPPKAASGRGRKKALKEIVTEEKNVNVTDHSNKEGLVTKIKDPSDDDKLTMNGKVQSESIKSKKKGVKDISAESNQNGGKNNEISPESHEANEEILEGGKDNVPLKDEIKTNDIEMDEDKVSTLGRNVTTTNVKIPAKRGRMKKAMVDNASEDDDNKVPLNRIKRNKSEDQKTEVNDHNEDSDFKRPKRKVIKEVVAEVPENNLPDAAKKSRSGRNMKQETKNIQEGAIPKVGRKRKNVEIEAEVEETEKIESGHFGVDGTKLLRVALKRDTALDQRSLEEAEKLKTAKLGSNKPAAKGKRGKNDNATAHDGDAKPAKMLKELDQHSLEEAEKVKTAEGGSNKPAAKGKRGKIDNAAAHDGDAKPAKMLKELDQHSLEEAEKVKTAEGGSNKPAAKGKRGKNDNATAHDGDAKPAKMLKELDQHSLEEAEKVKTAEGGSNKPAAKGKRGKDDNATAQDSDAKPSKIPKEVAKSKGQSKKDKMPDVTLLDFNNVSTSPSGKAWNLKLSSWNINGVRAWIEKDGISYLRHESPDIMCVQETKCSDAKLPEEVNVDGYHCYWLAGDKDGYSGVGLLSKIKPISVKYGIDIEVHDKEGRVITAEYEKFFLVSAYVPNAGRGLIRLDYRMQWDKDFLSYLKSLDEKKPLVLCGDLNVAHEEIDLANPKTNKKNAGFTKEEREGFSTLLSEGFIDSFRHLYPEEKSAYTFWTYMMNARAKNVGWRLDYFVISKRFTENLCDNVMRKDVFGSDHCPITLFLSI